MNQCYDQASRPGQFCSLITRGAGTNQILNVQNGTFNVATESLAGLDVRASYSLPLDIGGLDDGNLDINAGWSRLFEHDFKSSAQITTDERLGQVGDFKDRFDAALFYSAAV